MHVSDIPTVEGVKILNDENQTIVVITTAKIVIEETAEEAEETEEETEEVAEGEGEE
jgi:hypothetical protein